MRTKVNWGKANELVDSYSAKLRNSKLPSQYGSAWMRSEMERVGLVEDRESIHFSEFWAIWFCCLIATKRVKEISSLERQTVAKRGNTSGRTIRMCQNPKTMVFGTESARVLRELIFSCPWI